MATATAVVTGNLRQRQMIDLQVDGKHLATTFGTAKIKYTKGPASRKYMLNINHGETFFHIDAIEVYQRNGGAKAPPSRQIKQKGGER